MQPELSRKARRALDALRGLAGTQNEVTASWSQIANRAGMSRSATAQGMRELAYAGEIIAINKESGLVCGYRFVGRGTQETAGGKRGHKLQACSDSMTTALQNAEPVHTSADRCIPVHTGTPPDELSTDDEFDDDDARAKKISDSVAALLGEYGLKPPFKDMLVKDITPAITKGVMTLDDARAICAKTLKEAEVWRKPAKIMFVRLRTRARGVLQDPLPLILEMPSEGAAAQGQKIVKTYQKRQYRKGGVSRRPQVHYTEETRKMAEERARQQIAERAARREKEATNEHANCKPKAAKP